MKTLRHVILCSMIAALAIGTFCSFGYAQQQLVINSYISDPVPKEAFDAQIALFKQQNPDINVTLSVTAHEDFKKALRIWLVSDTPPDVVTWFAGNRARFFIDKGLIMDITDVWKDAGLFEKFPKAFQSVSFVDDKAYFLPTNWYWWGVYYRKSIFAKYNLSEPKTWDEFMKVCETLKQNNVAPIAIGSKAPWTLAGWFDYLNLRVNGFDFHIGLMLGKEKYSDSRVQETFKYWRQLLDNGYFLPNAASYMWQEAVPFMVKSEAAMYLMGQFIQDSVPKDVQADLDFFQFPVIKPDVPLAEDTPTDGFMIPAKAKNVDAAKKFMKFLASKEAQQLFTEKTGRIGTNSEVPMEVYPPATQKGIKMIQGTASLAQFYDRDTRPEMAEKGMDGFSEFWAMPDNIGAILDRLTKEEERIFKEELKD